MPGACVLCALSICVDARRQVIVFERRHISLGEKAILLQKIIHCAGQAAFSLSYVREATLLHAEHAIVETSEDLHDWGHLPLKTLSLPGVELLEGRHLPTNESDLTEEQMAEGEDLRERYSDWLLGWTRSPSLECIELSDGDEFLVTADALSVFFGGKLRHIGLSGTNHAISIVKALNLDRTKDNEENGLPESKVVHVTSSCPSLRRLNADTYEPSQTALLSISARTILPELPDAVDCVSLGGYSFIHPDAIAPLASRFSHLRELYLIGSLLANAQMRTIAQLPLRTLHMGGFGYDIRALSNNELVTDEGLDALVACNCRLESLALLHFVKITTLSVHRVLLAHRTTLSHLSLRQCTSVSDLALDVADKMPTLQSVTLVQHAGLFPAAEEKQFSAFALALLLQHSPVRLCLHCSCESQNAESDSTACAISIGCR